MIETSEFADADAAITIPDIGVLFRDVLGASLSSAFGGQDADAVRAEIAKKYQAGGLLSTTDIQKFRLVREADGWKAFLDWKEQKGIRDREKRVAALLRDAQNLRGSKQLDAAAQKYREVLAHHASNHRARGDLRETEGEIAALGAKRGYLRHVAFGRRFSDNRRMIREQRLQLAALFRVALNPDVAGQSTCCAPPHSRAAHDDFDTAQY